MNLKQLGLTIVLAAPFALSGMAFEAQADPAPYSQSYQQTTYRGRLGAKLMLISPALRSYFGAPKDTGLLVDTVLPDSPGKRAGLQTGDVIVSVAGTDVSEMWDILNALQSPKKGETVKISVIRNKKKVNLVATLDTDAKGIGLGQKSMLKRMPFKAFGESKDHSFATPFFEQGDLADKVRLLEERLQRLENAAPKKGKKLKSSGTKARKL